jgi:RNA polymerase-binding protein DksA
MKTDVVRERLLKQREELVNRVDRTSKHLFKRDKPVSSIFSEQSVEMESRELIYRLDGEGKEEIRRIDKALNRLQEGVYEICENCGEDIAQERLEALPFTDLCIECARSEGG